MEEAGTEIWKRPPKRESLGPGVARTGKEGLVQQKQTLWRRYMPVLLFVLILVIFSFFLLARRMARCTPSLRFGNISDAADRAPFAFHVLDVGKADSLLFGVCRRGHAGGWRDPGSGR